MASPPPVPPSPRRRDAAATRSALVQAALDLFTTVGYHGTTTALVAERAGVAEGTIYRHFAGKDQLFAEVHREAERWGAELVKGTADPDRPLAAPERLQRIGRRLMEAADREPALLRMALGGRSDLPHDYKGKETAWEFREAVQQVIASGKSDGIVRAGPAELWGDVWLAIVGFAAEKVASREWPADHPSVAMVLDSAWDAVAT